MDVFFLKFWGEDSNLDSTGPYFFLNATSSSDKMLKKASVLFLGNPDYKYFSDQFTPMPNKDELRVGQRVVVLVNHHYRELEEYKNHLKSYGYPPMEEGGQEFSKTFSWVFEEGSWVMDYTKK